MSTPPTPTIRVANNGTVRINGCPAADCDTRDLITARDSIDASHAAWPAIVAALATRGGFAS